MCWITCEVIQHINSFLYKRVLVNPPFRFFPSSHRQPRRRSLICSICPYPVIVSLVPWERKALMNREILNCADLRSLGGANHCACRVTI